MNSVVKPAYDEDDDLFGFQKPAKFKDIISACFRDLDHPKSGDSYKRMTDFIRQRRSIELTLSKQREESLCASGRPLSQSESNVVFSDTGKQLSVT